MAQTKHQKLANGMRQLLDALETHFHKAAVIVNSLQLHFYEPIPIIGRPLMTKQALLTLMRTHICGLKLFSPCKELRTAAHDSPQIGIIVTPPFYLASNILTSLPDEPTNAKWLIPWRVAIYLPSKNLQKLNETKLEALLYCASESEMSEWIDWFDHEDKAGTLTNQFFAIDNYYQERAPIEQNLNQPAFPYFRQAVLDYFMPIEFPKAMKTLSKNDFAKKNTTVAQSYELITTTLRMRKKRHFEDFHKVWRDRLIELIFTDIDWPQEKKEAILEEYFPSKRTIPQKKNGKVRWKTSLIIDRQTYGAFISLFSNRFLENPLKNKSDGETALLLWVISQITQDPSNNFSITRLLELSTANLTDFKYLSIDDIEIELSYGLANLLEKYAGEGPYTRHHKLFPNLTIDKLEDSLRRASLEILPPGSTPALPEAFLTFPHPHKNVRMTTRMRRQQQQSSPQIFYESISRKELKRQLIEKSSSNRP